MTEPASTLFIDDEPDLVPDALRDAFEDEGLSLDIAATWAEGMAQFAVVGYELVIADYDLREAETGLRLLAEIKALAPSTRLILVSGRLPADTASLVREAQVVDLFLSKTDPKLREVLLKEAREAHEKSHDTDWGASGRAHPRAAEVDLDKIAGLEAELKLKLGPRA